LNWRREADVLEEVQAVPVVVQAESPMLASAAVLKDIGPVIVRNHRASAAAGEAEMVAGEVEMVEVEAEMVGAGEDLLLLAGADPLPPVLAPGLRVGGADLPGRPIEGPRGEIGPHRHRRRGTSPRRETGPKPPQEIAQQIRFEIPQGCASVGLRFTGSKEGPVSVARQQGRWR